MAAFDFAPESEDDRDGESADVAAFADFVRATRVPGRGPINGSVQARERVFSHISCAVCHTAAIVTAPAWTAINGGKFTVPSELGNKIIHPFSDLFLHDSGTGDGIVQNGGENTASLVCTPPL